MKKTLIGAWRAKLVVEMFLFIVGSSFYVWRFKDAGSGPCSQWGLVPVASHNAPLSTFTQTRGSSSTAVTSFAFISQQLLSLCLMCGLLVLARFQQSDRLKHRRLREHLHQLQCWSELKSGDLAPFTQLFFVFEFILFFILERKLYLESPVCPSVSKICHETLDGF